MLPGIEETEFEIVFSFLGVLGLRDVRANWLSKAKQTNNPPSKKKKIQKMQTLICSVFWFPLCAYSCDNWFQWFLITGWRAPCCSGQQSSGEGTGPFDLGTPGIGLHFSRLQSWAAWVRGPKLKFCRGQTGDIMKAAGWEDTGKHLKQWFFKLGQGTSAQPRPHLRSIQPELLGEPLSGKLLSFPEIPQRERVYDRTYSWWFIVDCFL